MRAGLLFEGIGGFGLAFERAGIDNVWSVEIDDACTSILERHFPDVRHFRDVERVGPWVAKACGEVDVIAGGFPCQDISVAGHRAGLDGDRSKLWWEFARILDEQRPRWCCIENVAGLLSSNRGRDLGAILRSLGNMGYGFAYRVLDAQGFGVPQRRRRVFIVGCLGDARRAAAVLLEPESGGGDLAASTEQVEIASALTRNGLGDGGPDDNLAQANHLIPTPLTTRSVLANNPEYLIPFRKSTTTHGPDINDEAWEEAHVANTLDTGNRTRTSHAIVFSMRGREGGNMPEEEKGDVSPSLRGASGGSTQPLIAFHVTQDPIFGDVTPALSSGNAQGCATLGVVDEWGARKLMPIECERLQGFPDNWTEGQSDSTRYKQLGNAVAVPVVEWIARRMKEQHDG